jgi:hypothetical protein
MNVTNLMLVRASSRHGELALRAAIGEIGFPELAPAPAVADPVTTRQSLV